MLVAILSFLISLYLAAVFVSSGLAKLAQPNHFALLLHRHQVLSPGMIRSIVSIGPRLEIGLGCALVSGIMPSLIALTTTAVLLVFMLYKLILMRSGSAEDCGCFGASHNQSVDLASLIVSGTWVLLSALNFSLLMLSNIERFEFLHIATSVLFVSGIIYCMLRIRVKDQRSSEVRREG